MKKLIVASNNKGKIAEIKAILGGKFSIMSLKEAGLDIDVEENGNSFFENALIKAKAVYELTGEYTLSDDSGLCVDALNGAPGIYSARYAGSAHNDEANNSLLLDIMNNKANRAAHFACSVVLYMGNDNYVSGFGTTKGEILKEKKGNNGFGYDTLFYSHELNKPFGQATADEKNSVSHRRRALDDLLSKIAN